MARTSGQHRWRFYRAGGLEQVALDTAADLRNLENLDQKLWVALSCPVKGLELDRRTLELIDLDGDGRVRASEILAAVRFCDARLRDLGDLIPGGDSLPLSAIDPEKPEGAALLGAARRVLQARGRAEAAAVTPADVADTSHVFDESWFNGDGVVPPEAAEDPEIRQLIVDAMACAGSRLDRSGRQGIDRALLDAFYGELAACAAWWETGMGPSVRPLGDRTDAAQAALAAVRAKVDDFFHRCRIAALVPGAEGLLNGSEPELVALAARDLSAPAELERLAIARAEAGRALPLAGDVNPAWEDRLAALARDAVEPILGAGARARASITEGEWRQLGAALAAHDAWRAARRGASVERLGAERIRALLAGAGRAAVEALLARDEACAAEARAVADLVRMVHYRRDLHTLLRNFVSFADFYDPRLSAVFQAGTLYLDGRSCDLCVRVDDPGAHASLAALSRMYIAYCECRRPGGESTKVAACFTQGDSDHLLIGRNGIFYDRGGRDWDATIVKIIDNPISIRQAFFSPYKKLLRLIEDQVARFAAAREKESEAKLAAVAAGTAGDGGKAAGRAEPVDIGRMVGIIAALGVGAGAIGTVFGGLVAGFLGLQPWWAKIVAVAGAVMAVSGPSMLIAWLKLRQRTLGPLLDGNGWAVNGRVRVNIPLGTALTRRASLPHGAARLLGDPYEDKAARRRRWVVVAIILLVAAALGWARWTGRWPFAEGPAPAPERRSG